MLSWLNLSSAPLSIINGDSFHPNHLLSPAPPSATIPVLHLPILPLDLAGSVAITDSAVQRRETTRSQIVTVRPPSFHAPLALMCAHAGGLFEATQTYGWWNHSCFLSRALTPQTLCPFLSSQAINVGEIFLKWLVEVKPASLKHRLIAVGALGCCCKYISKVRNDGKQTNNMPKPWKILFFWSFFPPSTL